MITLTASEKSNVLFVKVSEKLTKADYEAFGPKVEALIHQHGKLRIVIDLDDFHGWTAGALWEDIKFDLKHFSDIERVAFVGDKRWEKGMATFCKPFTTAKVRYFERAEIDKAKGWVAS